MEREVRCSGCGRLLGKIRNGIFENKHGRQIIRAERAIVTCPKCGMENDVGRRVEKRIGERSQGEL